MITTIEIEDNGNQGEKIKLIQALKMFFIAYPEWTVSSITNTDDGIKVEMFQ